MFSTSTNVLLSTVLLLGTSITPTIAEGINCHGNSGCQFNGMGVSGSAAHYFKGFVDTAPAQTMYPPGYQIACEGSYAGSALCLYTQATTKKYSAAELSVVLQDLNDHGCDKCGSAPLDRTVNDVSKGMLTINVTKNPSCDGLCALPKAKRAEEWTA
ncbi:MAG: hypothetical protein M1812_007460 [Candelaria pacifica]|nr:MAG: hypothetical protein M1812_007460 [Candelaria pacifica]